MMRLVPVMAALAIVLGGCALKDAPTRPQLMELAFPEKISLPPAWRAGPSASSRRSIRAAASGC